MNTMGNEVEEKVFQSSQKAIRKFMDAHGGSGSRNVNVDDIQVKISSSAGGVYNKSISVNARIETNESYVQLFGDAYFDAKYYTKYTNVYQVFTFGNNILNISSCTDKKGNAITISIG